MLNEKATSKSQQRLMGMVYAYKNGDLKLKSLPNELANKIKEIADGTHSGNKKRKNKGISKKAAKDFASTKHEGLPDKVEELLSIIKYDDFILEHLDEEYQDDELEDDGVEIDIEDDLKANFRNWVKESDNEDDTNTLTDVLIKRHPGIPKEEIYKIASEWTGYDKRLQEYQRGIEEEKELTKSNENSLKNFDEFLNENKDENINEEIDETIEENVKNFDDFFKK